MATADDYAKWIVTNADKKGTPEFETVTQAYQAAKQDTVSANEMPAERRPPPAVRSDADAPGRPVPGVGGMAIGFDLLGLPAGEIVPGPIVFTHMVEAEPAMAAEVVGRTRCAVIAGRRTARTVAAARRRRDVVKGGASSRHGDSMGGLRRPPQCSGDAENLLGS